MHQIVRHPLAGIAAGSLILPAFMLTLGLLMECFR